MDSWNLRASRKPPVPEQQLQPSPADIMMDHERPRGLLSSTVSFFEHPWCGVLVSSLYFLSASLVMSIIMNFVNDRVPTQLPSLPDVGHEWLPLLRPESLGDILLGLLVSFWILFVVLVVERHQLPGVLIKWLMCHGTLYFFRIITISVTSLPVTENHCRENYTRIGNMMWNTLLGIVSLGSLNQHCGDLLFSGHSVLVTLICLLFTDYCKRLGRDKMYDLVVLILRSIVYSLAFVICLFIIATRNHYTVDVVIGVYATFVTYKVMPDYWPFPPFK